MKRINHTDSVIDSRDVIERIAYLKSAWAEATGESPDDYNLSGDDWSVGLGADDAGEMIALLELADEARSYGLADWEYGVTLIHDAYFEEYAQELASDIGAIDTDAGWPASYIDWPAAADALKIDYAPVDFNGETYWAR